MDGHCSSPKTINNGVLQGSVLSPTLFLLFINDLLSLTECPIYSYANDITLHFSTSYNRRPNQQEINDSMRDAIGRLASDLSLISDWGSANLVLFNTSKTDFLQLFTRHNLSDNYPFFFNDTQLPLSTLNTLILSFTKNRNWQFHISTLAKIDFQEVRCTMASASIFLSLSAACSVQEPYPPMYGVWFSCLEGSTHTALLNSSIKQGGV